jgi:hypothetical protein
MGYIAIYYFIAILLATLTISGDREMRIRSFLVPRTSNCVSETGGRVKRKAGTAGAGSVAGGETGEEFAEDGPEESETT